MSYLDGMDTGFNTKLDPSFDPKEEPKTVAKEEPKTVAKEEPKTVAKEPFIIVSYFVLQSLLNWDLKGVVYLAGLLFCSVAIVMLNGPMKRFFPRTACRT